MSGQDIKRTEKEKSRLGLQVHAIMLFFNRTDMNATFPVSRTAQSKSCMQLLSTKHGRAPKTPNNPHSRASHMGASQSKSSGFRQFLDCPSGWSDNCSSVNSHHNVCDANLQLSQRAWVWILTHTWTAFSANKWANWQPQTITTTERTPLGCNFQQHVAAIEIINFNITF